VNKLEVIKIPKLKVEIPDNTVEWFQDIAKEKNSGDLYLGHIGALRDPLNLVDGKNPEPRQISFNSRLYSPLIGMGVSLQVSEGLPFAMTAQLEKESKDYGNLEVRLQGIEDAGINVLETRYTQVNLEFTQRQTPEGIVLSHAELGLPDLPGTFFEFFGMPNYPGSLGVEFTRRICDNSTYTISEREHRKLPSEYYSQVAQGFVKVLEAIVDNLVDGNGEEHTLYLNKPILMMDKYNQDKLRRSKLKSRDIADLDELVHTNKAVVLLHQQDFGGSLVRGTLDRITLGDDKQSGPRKLVDYGLVGAIYDGGFSDVSVSNSEIIWDYSQERAAKLGSDIKKRLGLSTPRLDVVGYPYNIKNQYVITDRSVSTPIIMPTRNLGQTNVPGPEFLSSTILFHAIDNLNILQHIHTSNYLQCLEEIARGNFIVHFSASHDGDIGPTAAIAHYMHLMGLNVGLVAFDAHGDYNPPGLSPSGNLHGMHYKIATKKYASSCHLTKLGSVDPDRAERKVDPRNMLHVGGRAFDPWEYNFMVRDGVNVFTMEQLSYVKSQGWLPEVFSNIYNSSMKGVDAVMISIDFDVLDPNATELKSQKLAVRMPEKNGLYPEDMKTMLGVIAEGRIPVLGIFGSELTPKPDILQKSPDFETSGKSFSTAVDIVQDFFSLIIV